MSNAGMRTNARLLFSMSCAACRHPPLSSCSIRVSEPCPRHSPGYKGCFSLAHHELTPGLVVVVAGQRLPELSSEWDEYCCRMALAGLHPSHWFAYAQQIKVPLSEETVQAFHTRFHGLPAEMVNTLGMFAPGRGGQ